MAKTLSNHGNVSAFREQFQNICSWFEEFNSCEKLIVLYSLFYKVSMQETRFLQNVLERRAQSEPPEPGGTALEKEANDADYVNNLQNAPKEAAITSLSSHLPLLHPGNSTALASYITVLESLLQYVVDTGCHRNGCMQLLSLAIVHPAVPPNQRTTFLWWQDRLSGKNAASSNIPGINAVMTPHAVSATMPPPTSNHILPNGQGQVPRTWRPTMEQQYVAPPAPPLPPPQRYSPSQMLTVQFGGDGRPTLRSSSMQTSSDMQHADDGLERGMSRSQSLPMPMRPSGKVAIPDRPERSGMKDVPAWLKSLRLHKYQDLFAEMTYEEMLGLTDDSLQEKGVTTGARHKILLSLQKLRQRSELLQRNLVDLDSPGKLLSVIAELRYILTTPIKPVQAKKPAPSATAASDSAAMPTAGTTDSATASLPATLEHSSERTSPVESNASMGPQWPQVERRESENALSVENFESNDTRTHGTNSLSSISSVGSSNSSGSRNGSDVGPSPSPTNNIENEDLPALITEVLVKAFNQLLSSGADEETCTSFLTLLDKALCHEAFGVDARHQFFFLKQKCQQVTRQAQRKVLHESARYMRNNWHMPANIGNIPPFHHPNNHTLPLGSSQSLPRAMPPPAPPAGAPTPGVVMSAHRRRGFERQNARNSTVGQTHSMNVPSGVPPTVALSHVPPAGPPNITNPFGAPGSGRRSAGMPPVVMPDSSAADRNEMWTTSDYSTSMIGPDAGDQVLAGVSGNGAMASPATLLAHAASQAGNSMSLAMNGLASSATYSASDSYMESLCRSMTEHALNDRA